MVSGQHQRCQIGSWIVVWIQLALKLPKWTFGSSVPLRVRCVKLESHYVPGQYNIGTLLSIVYCSILPLYVFWWLTVSALLWKDLPFSPPSLTHRKPSILSAPLSNVTLSHLPTPSLTRVVLSIGLAPHQLSRRIGPPSKKKKKKKEGRKVSTSSGPVLHRHVCLLKPHYISIQFSRYIMSSEPLSRPPFTGLIWEGNESTWKMADRNRYRLEQKRKGENGRQRKREIVGEVSLEKRGLQ